MSRPNFHTYMLVKKSTKSEAHMNVNADLRHGTRRFKVVSAVQLTLVLA